MKIGTPFKADTLEIILCSREKIKNSMNVSTLFRFCSIERLRIHVVQVSFNSSYVIHLADHLRTAILLSDTIYIACLRITLGTQCKQGQLNDTLCKDQELQNRSTLSILLLKNLNAFLT